MRIVTMPLSGIAVEGSIYRFLSPPPGDPDAPFLALLERSLRSRGVECPLVVHRRADGEDHLVDGFRRARLAEKLGIREAPCRLLVDAELPELIDLLVILRFPSITASAAAIAEFLAFAAALGAPEELIIGRLLPALGLDAHRSVLERCQAVAALPGEALDFCREKRFSLKQCAKLAGYPPELVRALFAWKGELALTASILEELLDHLGDHLRAGERRFADFAGEEEVEALLSSRALGPAEKTSELRRIARELRFPTLARVNAEIDRIVSDLALPGAIRIAWDRTLEIREVGISATVTSAAEWSRILGALQEERFARAIGELLASL